MPKNQKLNLNILDELHELEQALSYRFKNREFLIEALTHPSLKQYNNSINVKDYERLEFLGDTILNFIITELLFKKTTTLNEGHLAKIRSYLVCKETICKVVTKINLKKYMLMTRGEEASGGRDSLNNIENTAEALIAAIYLDGGINAVRRIIQKLWDAFINVTDLANYDPKSTLQEWAQKNNHKVPIYNLLDKQNNGHMSIFTVSVTVKNYQQKGTGTSIKDAEKNAARTLLQQLHIIKKS